MVAFERTSPAARGPLGRPEDSGARADRAGLGYSPRAMLPKADGTQQREENMSRTSAVEAKFVTRNDLPAGSRTQVAELLNRRLADALDLQSQCKQAHWNVKGPQFIALHKLFDDVYADVTEYADLLAERIVQLGGVARGTVRDVAEASELETYPASIFTGEDHVKSLASAVAAFGSRMRSAIGETEARGDAASADICTEITRGADKWLWFIEAHGQAKS
jgi:starvation-inducible DNA-binding protein